MELVCKQQSNENIVGFCHYIWFIDSENLYLILNLKDKMTRF